MVFRDSMDEQALLAVSKVELQEMAQARHQELDLEGQKQTEKQVCIYNRFFCNLKNIFNTIFKVFFVLVAIICNFFRRLKPSEGTMYEILAIFSLLLAVGVLVGVPFGIIVWAVNRPRDPDALGAIRIDNRDNLQEIVALMKDQAVMLKDLIEAVKGQYY